MLQIFMGSGPPWQAVGQDKHADEHANEQARKPLSKRKWCDQGHGLERRRAAGMQGGPNLEPPRTKGPSFSNTKERAVQYIWKFKEAIFTNNESTKALESSTIECTEYFTSFIIRTST